MHRLQENVDGIVYKISPKIKIIIDRKNVLLTSAYYILSQVELTSIHWCQLWSQPLTYKSQDENPMLLMWNPGQ